MEQKKKAVELQKIQNEVFPLQKCDVNFKKPSSYLELCPWPTSTFCILRHVLRIVNITNRQQITLSTYGIGFEIVDK